MGIVLYSILQPNLVNSCSQILAVKLLSQMPCPLNSDLAGHKPYGKLKGKTQYI